MSQKRTLLFGLILLCIAPDAVGQLALSKVFGNGMVLQREHTIPVWGSAAPGAVVSVTSLNTTVTADADSIGNWRVELDPLPTGGPFFLTIESGASQITLNPIYVGDVFLASGQSNMELTVGQSDNAAAEIATANDPLLRQFKVQKGLANGPSDSLPNGSAWTPATSQYVSNFSAVAYFTARELREALNIPIGILNISYGGSRIETWMSDSMLGYDESTVTLANGEPERQPTLAFNKMINPVVGLPVKAFLWYQGESNADNLEDALNYGALFKTMINGWRELWSDPDLPFLWVQLPGFGSDPGPTPSAFDAWPQLRQGQSDALTLEKTGEAVILDLGGTDIHPTNKKPVGERLALVARHVVYGEDLVYSGPRFVSNMLEEDGRVRITYDGVGGGLVAAGETLGGFAIAGGDGAFKWAEAAIDGSEVIVWNESIPTPIEVRYAWEYNPTNATLYNAESLPAAPFTDFVNPGFLIANFSASRTAIEPDQSTTLSWKVFNAASVTLDGDAMPADGSVVKMPTESTEYELRAVNVDNEFDTVSATVMVEVLDPNLIDRALNQPATASTFESCCGEDRIAAFAVDGLEDTRWSSAWSDGTSGASADPNIDDDPDDEWLKVDLGSTIDIERVILRWEAAYGSQYDLQVSWDGYLWRTVYEERAGNGGEDNIVLDSVASGRYLRMHGLQRATQYGYSLFSLSPYGMLSSVKPPVVSLESETGNVVPLDASVTVQATTTDGDGSVVVVEFFVDAESAGVDDTPPFELLWDASDSTPAVVTAIATDDAGLSVQSHPLVVYVDDGSWRRFEAENGSAAGSEADVILRESPAASGGSYLELRDAWTLTFPEFQVPAAGEYLLSIGYQLTFDSPKTQYLVVNGDTVNALEFTAGSSSAWLQIGVPVMLQAGANEVALHGFWNWMSIDFLAVDGTISGLASDELSRDSNAPVLAQNSPNPTSDSTTIVYFLPSGENVTLELFDLAGRRVAKLVDRFEEAGRHSLAVDLSGFASGVYVYRLTTSGQTLSPKLSLIR